MPQHARSRALLTLVLVFVVSRLLFQPISLGVSTFSLRSDALTRAMASLKGQHFNESTLGDGMPLLDRELLLHDFWRSIWYLHSQPPLFNGFVAAALRLPGAFAENYQWLNWVLGLALYVCAFMLMRILGVASGVAAAGTILFMLNPNSMWMESAVYYGLPVALLLVIAALSWYRAMRNGSVSWLAVASSAVVAVSLTRAFFTPFWCAAVLLGFGFGFVRKHRAQRSKVLAATLVPCLLLAAFEVKQYVLFHQFLGSSWFGCNLATMTATMSGDKARALRESRVSPLVNVYRNAPPQEFLKYFHVQPTGIPALDAIAKSTGQPNFNHIVYIAVGRTYLRDTLYLIRHHPLKYLLNVVNSTYIFSGYQIGVYFDRPQKFFARFSWMEIAAPLIGFPLLLLSLWTAIRTLPLLDEDQRWLAAFLVLNVAYVMAVSCLFEKSEGPLYRYQVDAFLWTFLAIFAESRLLRRVSLPGDEGSPISLPLPSGDVRN